MSEDEKVTAPNTSTESVEESELTEEEFNELVLEAQREALAKKEPTPKRQVPKWFIWLLSSVLVISTFAGLFQVFSIPAIEFLRTSASLSTDPAVSKMKEAVVVVITEDGKGTGFSIDDEGLILTNSHVIEGNRSIYVKFPEAGRFEATVLDDFPEIDLAILQIDGENLPSLPLAQESNLSKKEHVTFIGNPLSFKGIVNEGSIIEPIKLDDWTEEVYMMEAPVYRGNSGSPVINEEGEVIGIVFATLDHEEHGKVGLFIPIELYYQYTND